jgi:integrase
MANKKGHRRFGNVRRRTSGRYQARYIGADGLLRPAPHTFADKGSAERWLILMESEILRGDWQAPEDGQIPLAEYALTWISERKLSPRTRELYEMLYRLHVGPYLGSRMLARITPEVVRRWRSDLLRDGRSEWTAAKAYRLLRAVLNTAVREDRVIRSNPCTMKGYDKEPASARYTARVEQVWQLSDLVERRYRALILFAAFVGLRWGEIVAIRLQDIDLDAGQVRVTRKFAELQNGQRVVGPPKTEAGFRTLALPSIVVTELRRHLKEFPPAEGSSLVFVGPKGAPLRRNNFHRTVRWQDVTKAVGLPEGFHFHDLRHTGNTLTAASGASTRELMHRLGHASMRAALIYQHATSERDREIADALGKRIRRPRPRRTAARDRSTEGG